MIFFKGRKRKSSWHLDHTLIFDVVSGCNNNFESIGSVLIGDFYSGKDTAWRDCYRVMFFRNFPETPRNIRTIWG